MADKTLQDQFIELDAQFRTKAAEYDMEDNLPSADDMQELHNMESGLDTLKLKMDFAALQAKHDNEAEAEAVGHDVPMEDAVKSYMATDQFKTKSSEELHMPLTMKTLFTTSAGWAPRAPFSGIVAPAALRMPVAMDYIQQIPTADASVVYMEQTTHTSSAAPVAEGSAPSQAAYVYTTRESTVRRISTIIPVTEEVLADAPLIESLLRQNLTGDLMRAVENQVLTGNGTAPNLRGIRNFSSVQTYSKPSDEHFLDAGLNARNLIVKNAFVAPDLWIMHPDDYRDMGLIKAVETQGYTTAGAVVSSTEGFGRYIWNDPVGGLPRFVHGMAVIESTAVSAGNSIMGAFGTQCHIRDRQDVTFRFGTTGTQFNEGELTIRADVRLAFYPLRGNAFVAL